MRLFQINRINLLNYCRTVRNKRKSGKSATFFSKRNADNRNEECATHDYMKNCKPEAENRSPKKIAEWTAVKIDNRGTSEGPYNVASYFYKLYSRRNEYYSKAESNAKYEVYGCHPESIYKEPNNIAYEFHSISSKRKNICHYNYNTTYSLCQLRERCCLKIFPKTFLKNLRLYIAFFKNI